MRHTTEEQAAEANAAKAAMAPAGADAVAAGRHCPTHFAHDAGPNNHAQSGLSYRNYDTGLPWSKFCRHFCPLVTGAGGL